MVTSHGVVPLNFQFIHQVKERSGQPLDRCYQCQKCAAGCQVGAYIDFQPNQIIRLIQFGLKDELLKSNAIWLCVNCDTCGARCPNGISISAVTDALREMALEEKVIAKEKNVAIFHDTFLNAIKSGGRVHEVTMLMRYKLKSGRLFDDVLMGMGLLKRGKMPLLPSRVKNRDKVKKIFASEREKKVSLGSSTQHYNNTSV